MKFDNINCFACFLIAFRFKISTICNFKLYFIGMLFCKSLNLGDVILCLTTLNVSKISQRIIFSFNRQTICKNRLYSFLMNGYSLKIFWLWILFERSFKDQKQKHIYISSFAYMKHWGKNFFDQSRLFFELIIMDFFSAGALTAFRTTKLVYNPLTIWED